MERRRVERLHRHAVGCQQGVDDRELVVDLVVGVRVDDDPRAFRQGREDRAHSSSGSAAHGTSTESSIGESRATTYSAGSASERLTRMWVSRGGT